MPPTGQVVVESPRGLDDDLLLPRPPGVLRRFWARHPRVTDALVALSALLVSLPAATVRSASPEPPSQAQVWVAIAMLVAAAIALFFRRRAPLLAFAVAAIPSLTLPPSLVPVGHIMLAYALYAIAVYRSVRACWIAFGAIVAATAIYTLAVGALSGWVFSFLLSNSVALVVGLVIGGLLGTNVGNRRRYLGALIDRSRQLLVERDRQAQLAAAAERTRIAREMHDIVSHSLTVIVALSEGAAAAGSVDQARQASRAASETARAALTEMRAMLGVLRDGTEDSSPLEPLEPVDPARAVEAAQRAGYPVVLEVSGATADAPRPVRFALGRVVQEAVTNAMRHAPSAARVSVTVERVADGIIVTVDNDGAEAASDRGGGFGLRGLRERVEHVGGTFRAGPDGATGWMLRATLPLGAAIDEEES